MAGSLVTNQVRAYDLLRMFDREGHPAGAGSTRPVLQAITVDGKIVRGSRHAGHAAVTLLAAREHTGSVLTQRQIADKRNEIPAFGGSHTTEQRLA